MRSAACGWEAGPSKATQAITIRSRGKTCLEQADCHPRWRGTPNSKSVHDSFDAERLSRTSPNTRTAPDSPDALIPKHLNFESETPTLHHNHYTPACTQPTAVSATNAILGKASLPQAASRQNSICLEAGECIRFARLHPRWRRACTLGTDGIGSLCCRITRLHKQLSDLHESLFRLALTAAQLLFDVARQLQSVHSSPCQLFRSE